MDAWILVADGSRARLFSASKRGEPWKLIEQFEHPETRERTGEITPTERGTQKQAFGSGRPAMQPKMAPRDVEELHFAQQLRDKLVDGLKHNSYGGLVLVAPPKFLGQLKGMLDSQTSKCVVATVDKDYTQSNEKELMQRLEDAVHGVSAASK